MPTGKKMKEEWTKKDTLNSCIENDSTGVIKKGGRCEGNKMQKLSDIDRPGPL